MAKPPLKDSPIMPEPTESRTAHRRREKRAKKKALSLTSDPANPALAPKPQITKPHIVKPSISYGLQVSDLMLRDTIQLSQTPTPANDNELSVRGNVAQLAKLVLSQAGLPQRQLHSMDATPAVKPVKPVKTTTPAPQFKTRYNASNTFKFATLPAELRIMIEEFVFTERSGMKPKMLWAMEGNKELYPEAKEVWCNVNEFGFTYHESALNRIREGMEGAERKLVKRALVVVSKDIQSCTIFSPTILPFPNLTHLTLRVHTTSGLYLSIHHIIPKMSHLRQAHIPFDGAEFFRSFSKTRITLDKMLDRDGRCVRVGQRLQEWVWRVGGKDEVFRPRSGKVHIKFDEDTEEFALSGE
ncbi:hypothetical protein ACEPPN_015628 [Leptodophora sp. 'Broadleaf-Isolate-01']